MNSLKLCRILGIAVLVLAMGAVWAFAGPQGQVLQNGAVTGFIPAQQSNSLAAIDFVNAKPMPLPQSPVAPCESCEATVAPQYFGEPGVSPGKALGGVQAPLSGLDTISPASLGLNEDEFAPQEFGTSLHPFTTSRVDLINPLMLVSSHYPFAPTGKLYFNIGSSTYVCSASLIKRGVAVTAAHCVCDWGDSTFYSNWQFVPAKYDASAPYGTWTTAAAWVMTGYYNGATPCYAAGVVCPNDIAVLAFSPNGSGYYPGNYTGGWYGYAWNGWGFNSENPKKTHLSQLGYPVSHDSGNRMQRTDSYGFTHTTMNNNTVWGSRQTGGSSGGPEIANLGALAVLSGTSTGTYPNRNIVIGVTSWGYTNTAVKQQGASPFTEYNITALVGAVCASRPAACQ